MRLAVLFFALLVWPGLARAEWLEASSAHFIVYVDDTPDNARRFADRLERYHAAMELVTRRKTPPVSPSNRLTVYVVERQDEVHQLAGSDDSNIDGFYLPRAGASLAVVPPLDADLPDEASEGAIVALLHEYAHHFLISTSSFAMPLWYVEGAAEFFASARFDAKGGVALGRSSAGRLAELRLADHIVVRDLLDTSKDDGLGGMYLGFYARSWQLYHYLIFEPAREGQLARYLARLTAGASSRDAALAVFGDFATLDRELHEYGRRRKTSYFAVPPEGIQPGPVDVRALSAGAAAMMPLRIRLRVGIDAEEARTRLAEARAIAARFPGDAAVLSILAEAEYAAVNDAEAIAAADAAIAADPAQLDAYVQKGLALFRVAESGDAGPEAFERARAAFAAVSARETDHPLPLVYIFRSYLAQGLAPTPLAMEEMRRAVELAPFDPELRLNLALQQIRLGQPEAARANLLPVAYNPHGTTFTDAARKALAYLDAKPGRDGDREGAGDTAGALPGRGRTAE